jgi:broad specificity phosphatase PhoE
MNSLPTRATVRLPVCFAYALLFGAAPPAQSAGTGTGTTETIVLIRHGEKPQAGLGQLDCQGLNRALALPPVLLNAFGKPAAIFAPNPSAAKTDNGILYDYIRPLATIEPTAIAYGMPVHTGIGQARIEELRRQLNAPAYHDAYVLIAWEHTEAMLLARALMKQHGGDPGAVPDWKGSDFDSIYVVTIHRAGPAATASFALRHEGLDGQKAACPGAE